MRGRDKGETPLVIVDLIDVVISGFNRFFFSRPNTFRNNC